jgi:hypothetical protein
MRKARRGRGIRILMRGRMMVRMSDRVLPDGPPARRAVTS